MGQNNNQKLFLTFTIMALVFTDIEEAQKLFHPDSKTRNTKLSIFQAEPSTIDSWHLPELQRH